MGYILKTDHSSNYLCSNVRVVGHILSALNGRP